MARDAASHFRTKRDLNREPRGWQEHAISSLSRVAEDAFDNRRVSALAARWSRGARTSSARASEGYEIADGREPAQDLFDLASVAKLFTATLALVLDQHGRLALDRPLDDCWSQTVPNVPAGRGVALEDLLRHRAGMIAWWPIYDEGVPWGEECGRFLLTGPLRTAARDTYSDLSVMLWGLTVERILGRSLYELLLEQVLRPLDLQDVVQQAANVDLPRIVPCGLGMQVEQRLSRELGLTVEPPRPPEIGESQDGNARWFGRYTGHAGLWGTVDALHTLGLEWAACLGGGQSRLGLDSARAAAALSGAQRRRLGWWAPMSVMGGTSSPVAVRLQQGYGHTGFVGGSLWMEPKTGSVATILAHRTHTAVDLTDLRLAVVEETL